jgi:Tol biopolymer transport system component
MPRPRPAAILLAALLAACGRDEPSSGDASPAGPPPVARKSPAVDRPAFPGEERHLSNLRQLTFGGENAEAYWSNDGTRIVFQSTRPPYAADQIFTMAPDGSDVRLVSTGKGRTTCAWFMPGDRRVLFSSTHLASDEPPKPPDRSQGYVWGVFDTYDLFTASVDGGDVRPLAPSPGYDAEATGNRQGTRIVFTSTRDGDLDLYSCAIDGSDVRRLTDAVGYDGGAVWSPDGTKIAWRAQHPESETGKADFQGLLSKSLVRPNALELWVMDADGSGKRRVTSNGKANFGPWFTHDGKALLFSSNLDDPKGRSFDLYRIALDGTGLERVTHFTTDDHDDFDGFPMLSPDGKRLLWCSNRHHEKPRETNVFVADWKD